MKVHPRNSVNSKTLKVRLGSPNHLKLGKFRRFWAHLLVWGGLSVLPHLAQAHTTQIYGGTGCIDGPKLEGQITQLLIDFAPDRSDTKNLTARIAISLSSDNLSASIKLTDTSGRTALARRYQLHKNDCPDVPDLLSLVLQEFLREFPENPWQAPQEVKDSPTGSARDTNVHLRLGLSLLSQINPSGVKFESNAHLQGAIFEGLDWQIGLHIRAGMPQPVSDGSYQRLEFLLGAGFSLQGWQTLWDIQILGGGYILSGQSFSENRIGIAPALEIVVGTRWYWEDFSIGPTFGLSVLQHQVQVLPENSEQPISILNIGLSIQYDTI